VWRHRGSAQSRYHDRSDSCCDDSWEHNPPKGDCDKGKSCPKGEYSTRLLPSLG